jgi:hypothetical protein
LFAKDCFDRNKLGSPSFRVCTSWLGFWPSPPLLHLIFPLWINFWVVSALLSTFWKKNKKILPVLLWYFPSSHSLNVTKLKLQKILTFLSFY